MIIIKLICLVLFGASILNIVDARTGWLEKIGLSFLLGTGVLSILYFLFIWNTNRVESFDFWAITLLLTVLFLILRKPNLPRLQINSNFLALLSWALIIIFFLSTVIYASYTPVRTPDSIQLFDFRSKLMFLSYRLMDIRQIEGWSSYPMFTSMIGLMWRFVGLENPSSYYPLMYLSFALIFYSVLRKEIGDGLAGLGTLLMYITPITFWQSLLDGLTNLPYTIFLCLAVIYAYKIMKEKVPSFNMALISSIFLGLSTWTRGIEPIWVVPLFLAVFVFTIKNKMSWSFIYFVTFSLIRGIWPVFVDQQYTSVAEGVKVILKSATTGLGAVSFRESFIYTIDSLFKLLPSSLGLVWYLFIVVLLLNLISRKFSHGQLYYLFSIVSILTIVFSGALFMVINFNLVIDTYNDSLSRLLAVIVPLLWFYIMINPAWLLIEKMVKWRVKS